MKRLEADSDKLAEVMIDDAVAPRLIRFGVYELDLESAELKRSGRRVRLAPQPFKVLAYLTRHAGRPVTREDLSRHIWGETVVDFDTGLNSCLKQIRAVLDDPSKSPRFIETLPRRGYRFIAPVESVASNQPDSVLALPFNESTLSPPPSAPTRRRHRGWWLAAATGITILGVSGTLWMRQAEPMAVSLTAKEIRAATDPAADALLKGHYLLSQSTTAEVERAADFFKQAIQLNSTFAPAYAALAEARLRLVRLGALPLVDGYPLVKQTATTALEYGPETASAHQTLAQVLWLWEWQWDAADASFTNALRLEPRQAGFHQQYALFLTSHGRHGEATRHIDRARELDPLSAVVNVDVAWVYFFAGRHENAIAASRRTLELKPGYLAACYVWLAAADQLGRAQESYAAAVAMVAAAGAAPEELEQLRLLDEEQGSDFIRDWWLEKANLPASTVPLYSQAQVKLDLGEIDRVFELLTASFGRREFWIAMLPVDPRFESLREDPRFREVLQKMKRYEDSTPRR